MNLDGLTCIQKFEVPLQVVNMIKMENSQRVKFEFESSQNRVYCSRHYRNTVIATVDATAHQGVIVLPP
jgi:hypothetical protein